MLHQLSNVVILVIYVLCLSMKHWVFTQPYRAGVVTMYHYRVHWSFKQVRQQLPELDNFFAYFASCNVFSLNTTQATDSCFLLIQDIMEDPKLKHPPVVLLASI